MKVFTVVDPIFKTEPLFVIGCTRDELRAYLRKRFRVDATLGNNTTDAGQMITFDCVPWRVVWTLKRDPYVLLHELFHLVTRICQDKGIPIRARDERGDFGDETAAYLFEFFAKKTLRKVL